MREVKQRLQAGESQHYRIEVADEPGPGGANLKYQIYGKMHGQWEKLALVQFQNKPPAEEVNGITHEVLLAIVVDRLRGFQAGPANCRENAIVLTKLEECLMWLGSRTADRLERGVEGKVTK